MGGLCGKISRKDNFSSPGHVVRAAPAPSNPSARVPQSEGRTLEGGGAGGAGRANSVSNEPAAIEARKKAAAAAEARAQAATKASKQGKLSGQLAEQKKRTLSDTLNQVSEENRRARHMDAATEARNYN